MDLPDEGRRARRSGSTKREHGSAAVRTPSSSGGARLVAVGGRVPSERSSMLSREATTTAVPVRGYGTMGGGGAAYRSMSMPVRSSRVVYARRAPKQLSVAQQSAKLAEKAKKNFFHGSFTSSHGAVFTVPNRAQQLAVSRPSRASSVVRGAMSRNASVVKRTPSQYAEPWQLDSAPQSALKKPGAAGFDPQQHGTPAPKEPIDALFHEHIIMRRRAASADARLTRPRFAEAVSAEHEDTLNNTLDEGEAAKMVLNDSSPDLLAVERMRGNSVSGATKPVLSQSTIDRAVKALKAYEKQKVQMPRGSFTDAARVSVDGTMLAVPEATPLVLAKKETPLRHVQITEVVHEDEVPAVYEESDDDEELDDISWCGAFMDLIYLGAPAAVTIAFTFCMSVIPLAFVGSYLGGLQLTGASVGYFLTCIIILYPMVGLTFAMDTLCSHEYGRDPLSPEMGLVLQRGVIINTLFLIPMCAVIYFLHYILLPIYGPELTQVATEFLEFSPIYLFADMLFIAFTKFLNNQMQPHLAMIALTAGVLLTIPVQMKLTPLGVRYTMIGMGITAWFQLALVVVFILFKPETRMTLGTWRLRDAVDWTDVKAYMKLAIPSAIFVAAEASSFDLTVLMCSSFGEADGAAWSGIMNSLFVFASFSGGLSASACANIGRCIGAYQPFCAKRYVLLSIILAFVIGLIDVFVLVGGFDFFLSLYGVKGKTLELARTVLFMLPFFHIADSVQFTFQGIFSGVGKNYLGAIILLTSLWGIGIPLSFILGHFLGYRMFGVCMGITIGLCIEAPTMVLVASTMDYHQVCEDFMEDEEEEEEEEETEEESEESEEEYDEEYVEEMMRRSGISIGSQEVDEELSEHYHRLLPPERRGRKKRRHVVVMDEDDD